MEFCNRFLEPDISSSLSDMRTKKAGPPHFLSKTETEARPLEGSFCSANCLLLQGFVAGGDFRLDTLGRQVHVPPELVHRAGMTEASLNTLEFHEDGVAGLHADP